VSLVARHLEENKIPTVVVGSARDIVEECGVARFLFTDFPLGNPCGKPWDKKMQRSIMDMTLDLYRFKGKWTDLRYIKETVLGYNHDRERRIRWNLKSVRALNLWSEKSNAKPAVNSILRKRSGSF